ncbi:hypothetical protein GGS23DRAFT_126899 [Durotheca rogersii]|uniref:uncharacterized protein n=1 Tax=Durotheca rogersii TaxID=419775 RepID=UPI002220852E|nr:uncharacterized protein GGS23DRAFT_126899 [Durotheca rogersii]KAI5861706.1 hypothetical protein GGS23DRAFT_126899 [Durotheca rogersii]
MGSAGSSSPSDKGTSSRSLLRTSPPSPSSLFSWHVIRLTAACIPLAAALRLGEILICRWQTCVHGTEQNRQGACARFPRSNVPASVSLLSVIPLQPEAIIYPLPPFPLFPLYPWTFDSFRPPTVSSAFPLTRRQLHFLLKIPRRGCSIKIWLIACYTLSQVDPEDSPSRIVSRIFQSSRLPLQGGNTYSNTRYISYALVITHSRPWSSNHPSFWTALLTVI